MTPSDAERFANEWVRAWNSHDLETILAHYAESPTHTSPLVAERLGIADGTIRDTATLRAYFGRGLEAAPDLHFDLLEVFAGVDGVTVLYTNQRGLRVLEQMHLDAQRRVDRTVVHWAVSGAG